MYRKVEQLVKSQIAGRWQSQDLNPGSLIPEVILLSIILTCQRIHSPVASHLKPQRIFCVFILFTYKGKDPLDKHLAICLKKAAECDGISMRTIGRGCRIHEERTGSRPGFREGFLLKEGT